MIGLYDKLSELASDWLTPLVNLVARIYVGMDFFKSGLLKFDDMEETIEMFEDDWASAVIFSPEISAYLATAGELILPIMLFIGLFTRVGAIGLFIMAVVIELFVFPGTVQHYYWMIILAMLVAQGGHKLSLDNWLLKVRHW